MDVDRPQADLALLQDMLDGHRHPGSGILSAQGLWDFLEELSRECALPQGAFSEPCTRLPVPRLHIAPGSEAWDFARQFFFTASRLVKYLGEKIGKCTIPEVVANELFEAAEEKEEEKEEGEGDDWESRQGIVLEEAARLIAWGVLQEEEDETPEEQKKQAAHLQELGLVTNPAFPFLACSPDGVIHHPDGRFSLLEIKFPVFRMNTDILHMPQVQMMMGMMHLPWCQYVCNSVSSDPDEPIRIISKSWDIPFCPEYFYREVIPRVRTAYFTWYFPALLCKLNQDTVPLPRPHWISQALQGVEDKKKKKQSGYVGLSFQGCSAPPNQANKLRLMRSLMGDQV